MWAIMSRLKMEPKVILSESKARGGDVQRGNKYCKDFDYIVASIEEDIIVKFYSRIGQYDFTKKDKIEPLKKSWTLINDVDGKGEYYFDSREVIKKINELVEAVNRLEGKVNGMV